MQQTITMDAAPGPRGKAGGFLARIMTEPPFRLAAKLCLSRLSQNVETIERWELAPRPHYFSGIFRAAKQAEFQGLKSFSAIEFGVATGAGLMELENYCHMIGKAAGMSIKVYGFDTGQGLPNLVGDHRDHPDWWKPGDYDMDVEKLKSKLRSGTELILGNVVETVETLPDDMPPIGFISFDFDLYSSTVDAMKILSKPDRNVLNRVALYFDDVDIVVNHRFAGELLAIDEFNEQNDEIKIDQWRGIDKNRPFPESFWLKRMYMAHHLKAISEVQREGSNSTIPNSEI